LSFPKFKFNWVNPTSFWRLDLSNRAQRVVMMSIICINHIESEFSKTKSGRTDTSQKNNWYNFRNERYAPPGEHLQEIEFNASFLTKLPTSGVVEFDYVSTTRPIISYKTGQGTNGHAAGAGHAAHTGNPSHPMLMQRLASNDDTGMLLGDVQEGSIARFGELHEGSLIHNEDSLLTFSVDEMSSSVADNASVGTHSSMYSPSQMTGVSSMYQSAGAPHNPVGNHNGSVAGSQYLSEDAKEVSNPFYGRALDDEEFDNFMKQLELDRGIRISKSLSIYKLLELQIAASKHYFTVQRVLKILDVLSDDRSTQARAVVCMVSRIIDLYNFDVILRHLELPVREEVLNSIGHLNCFNALKPGGDYIISLKHRDCRQFVLMMLGIAECENNPLTKDKYSDMAMVDVYQHKSRLLDTTSLQSLVLRFSYTDFCEQQASAKERDDINWDFRRNNINATLLGTKPVDRNQFRIINLYKEMEAAGTLSTGPIETQYLNHLKQKGPPRRLLQQHMQAQQHQQGASSVPASR
jgi:hypothetical protein